MQGTPPEPIDYYGYEFGPVSPLGLQDYPTNYMFYGTSFYLDSDLYEVKRQSSDIADAGGAIGGTCWTV